MMVVVKSRLFASDEELGKRDDDHKPGKTGPVWNVKHRPWWNKRQIFGGLLLVAFLYLFIRNLPEATAPKIPRPNPFGIKPQTVPHRALTKEQIQEVVNEYPHPIEPQQPAAKDSGQPPPAPPPSSKRNYDGPIRFYHLAGSLHASERNTNPRLMNKNVVFAASDLRSVAALIPIACEMSKWNRNSVHMAVMGRDEMDLSDIKRVNGADQNTCDIHWHDARPDYASTSIDGRMEVSVGGALQHIRNFMRPQVLITVDPDHEESFFNVGLHQKAKLLEIPIIQIPAESPEQLSWMARLDATALNSWHNANIDILVQVPLGPSGSLIRLLKSLAKADYTGFSPPRLSIELPPDVDGPTLQFLGRFQWPPKAYHRSGDIDLLTIRRRISARRYDADEASIRFIESFYPHDPKVSHVLLLSPQAELSPVFFHYLKLHLLEYRLSSGANRYDHLLGISLHTPSMHLNGSGSFEPDVSKVGSNQADSFTPFRWQAPNSRAAMYFGDKWLEVHSFLSKRDMAAHHPLTKDHHQNKKKLVSQQSPAWVEYFLDLMRVRGYYMHYPGLNKHKDASASHESLVTIHNELYHPPEEYSNEPLTVGNVDASPELPGENDVLTIPEEDSYLASHRQTESSQRVLDSEGPLLHSLVSLLEPFDPSQPHDDPDVRYSGRKSQMAMPALGKIALLDHYGRTTSEEDMNAKAETIMLGYRRLAGGCTERQAEAQTRTPQSAHDLFCLEDDADVAPLTPSSHSSADSQFDAEEYSDQTSPELETHKREKGRTPPEDPKRKSSEAGEKFPQIQVPKAPEEATRSSKSGEEKIDDVVEDVTNDKTQNEGYIGASPAILTGSASLPRLKPVAEPVEDADPEASVAAAILGAEGKKSERVEIPVQDAQGTREEKSWRQSQAKEAAAAAAAGRAGAGAQAAGRAGLREAVPNPNPAPGGRQKLTPAQRWTQHQSGQKTQKYPKPHPIDEDEHADEFLRLASGVKQQQAARRPGSYTPWKKKTRPDTENQAPQLQRDSRILQPDREQREKAPPSELSEVFGVDSVPDAETEENGREFAHRPWAPVEADRERMIRQKEKERALEDAAVVSEGQQSEDEYEEEPEPIPLPPQPDPATLSRQRELKNAAAAAEAARKEMDQ